MGSWFQQKLQQLGERVVDSVIDSVAENQQTHLKTLQTIQQSSISKLFHRVFNARYFYKQPNVRLLPVAPAASPEPPVGRLVIEVVEGRALLLPGRRRASPLAAAAAAPHKALWQVEVEVEGKSTRGAVHHPQIKHLQNTGLVKVKSVDLYPYFD
eukprot:GHVT01002328.1.p2 GENE.GHVT01002328.1~~GHVT01002328.1.p2  ORF type:complete len:155 (-),score=30.71 GHVT01002328.1:1089-1553(-)